MSARSDVDLERQLLNKLSQVARPSSNRQISVRAAHHEPLHTTYTTKTPARDPRSGGFTEIKGAQDDGLTGPGQHGRGLSPREGASRQGAKPAKQEIEVARKGGGDLLESQARTVPVRPEGETPAREGALAKAQSPRRSPSLRPNPPQVEPCPSPHVD